MNCAASQGCKSSPSILLLSRLFLLARYSRLFTSLRSLKRYSLPVFHFFAAMVLLSLTSCKSWNSYVDDRLENSILHAEQIASRSPDCDKVFSLQECIDMAIKNNLDLKVAELKSNVSDKKMIAETMSLFPDLVVTNTRTKRNNEPGSSSQNLSTGIQTYDFSRSSEKDESNFKVEMLLGVLDFGLAYLNASQAKDKALLDKQQEARVRQNLQLDVASTYFRVATMQDSFDEAKSILEKSEKTISMLNEMSEKKDISPMRLMEEQRRFAALHQSIMNHFRSYHNACIELRTLMGLSPAGTLRVDLSSIKQPSQINLPEISVLERISLAQRPELYSQDIQLHITSTEAYKTILMMFPNVQAFTDFNHSSNPFLYNKSWWEIGIRAAYNVLKLPQQVAKYRSLAEEAEENDMRVIAVSIGILAQVRIAYSEFFDARDFYLLENKMSDLLSKQLLFAKGNFEEGGMYSAIDILRFQMDALDARIREMNSLEKFNISYHRLINVVGVTSFEEDIIKQIQGMIEDKSDKMQSLNLN